MPQLRDWALPVSVLVGMIHVLSGKNELPRQSSPPGSPARTQDKHTTAPPPPIRSLVPSSPGLQNGHALSLARESPPAGKTQPTLQKRVPFEWQVLT